MAFTAFFNPDCLKANEADQIDVDGDVVTVQDIRECYEENAALIATLLDYENGIFSFTTQEYLHIPYSFKRALNIWIHIKAQEKK